MDKKLIPRDEDQDWECLTGTTKREVSRPNPALIAADMNHYAHNSSSLSLIGTGLRKRSVPYGPVLSLPKFEQLCPSKVEELEEKACEDIYAADTLYDEAESDTVEGDFLTTRSLDLTERSSGQIHPTV